MIPIPFLSRSEDARPLQRCIDTAAEETGHDSHAVIVVMTEFFRALADEVTHGRTVRIPSFGVFAAEEVPERHRKMSRNLRRRCKPVFVPSRGFRAQVGTGAHPDDREQQKIARYRKNHGGDPDQIEQRVFTGLAAMRHQIEAQLAGCRLKDAADGS